MNNELLAIMCLFAWSIFSFIVGIKQYRKEKQELLDSFNIETIKEEFQEIVHENMQGAIDAIGESFGEILSQPAVKGAMSVLGKKGGEANAQNIAVNDMAKDILDGPQFAAIKMGAEALGIDIDGYIEKHGAMKTLRAAQQLGEFAGINIMDLNLGNLSLPGASGSSSNPYLK